MPVTIQGLEDLNRRLKALEDVAKKPVLTKALTARAEIVRDAAKANAPRGKTGKLASNIFVGPRNVGSDLYEAAVEVGTGKDVFYGYFQEFGTGTSFEAAAARALGYPGQSKSKRHNMPSHPFLRPAVDSTVQSSMAALEAVLQHELHKAENA
jgi:HK97 gp10 family phage protein